MNESILAFQLDKLSEFLNYFCFNRNNSLIAIVYKTFLKIFQWNLEKKINFF